MSDSGQERRRPSERKSDDAAQADETRASSEAASRDVLDDVDELLDEIDDVLEENAEEFVRGYVQKGGQ